MSDVFEPCFELRVLHKWAGFQTSSRKMAVMKVSGPINTHKANRELIAQFGVYVGALVFVRGRSGDPSSVITNGTVSFIDTGKARIIVTCAHVIETFRKMKSVDQDYRMVITGGKKKVLEIDEKQLIECGDPSEIDFATFQLQDPSAVEALGKKWNSCAEWPPARAVTGNRSIFVGYPSLDLLEVPDGVEYNLAIFNDFITSVNPREFTMADPFKQRVVAKMNERLTSFRELSGMSGSAAYQVSSENNAELAGFVSRSGSGVNAPVFLVHSDFINSDGTLNHQLEAPKAALGVTAPL